jgi:hypothetical protein
LTNAFFSFILTLSKYQYPPIQWAYFLVITDTLKVSVHYQPNNRRQVLRDLKRRERQRGNRFTELGMMNSINQFRPSSVGLAGGLVV